LITKPLTARSLIAQWLIALSRRSQEHAHMDIDAVVAEVAAAVGLAEGPAGVADVLRVIARHEPVAAREVGRRAEQAGRAGWEACTP
jgi:hypothetical protein